MLKTLKINTALIVCFAFIFRLLFINVGVFAATNTSTGNHFLKKQLASAFKKRIKSTSKEYSFQEVFEEGLEDEDGSSGLKTSYPLTEGYCFLKGIFEIPKSSVPLDFIRHNLFPKRYLTISVLRI